MVGSQKTSPRPSYRGAFTSTTLIAKRFADPIEVARAILFLASDESSYVSGATLAVDGGASA